MKTPKKWIYPAWVCIVSLLLSGTLFAQLPSTPRLSLIPISGNEPALQRDQENAAFSPDIRISPSSKNYGNVPVGYSASQVFLISNTGLATLVITGVETFGPDTDQFTLDGPGDPEPPPYSLSPGVTVGVQISFRPTITGAKSGTVRIISNDPDESPFDVRLSGTGVAPDIDVTPAEKDFGQVVVGTSASQTFTVRNAGTYSLNVSATNLTGPDGARYRIDSGGGSFTLAAGQTRPLSLSFHPTVPGETYASLEIISSDPDENPFEVPLRGTGVAPVISVTPTALHYGEVATATDSSQKIVIRNEGTATLDIYSTILAGAQPGQFRIDGQGAPFTLRPGVSRDLVVTFRPTSVGTKNANLQLSSNDPERSLITVSLDGTGIEPDIEVTPGEVDFGEVAADSSARQVCLVSNQGNAGLVLQSIHLLGEDSLHFAITSNAAPCTLAPGDTLDIVVCFQPRSYGVKNTLLRLSSNDPDENPVDILLRGACSEREAPRLLYFYPSDSAKAVARNAPLQFKLTDEGWGLDVSSLHLLVNGTPVIADGIDQSPGNVTLDARAHQITVLYTPAADYDSDSVAVEIRCSDRAFPVNSLAAHLHFKVDSARVNITHRQPVGAEGGLVADSSLDVAVILPANALMDTLQILTGEVTGQPPLPQGVSGLGPVYYFSPDGLHVDVPITIALPYSAAELPARGLDNALEIDIYHYSTLQGRWEKWAPASCDASHIHIFMERFCYLTLATAAEMILTPLQLGGQEIVYASYPFAFSVNRVFTTWKNPLQYRFDWGDGTSSHWSADTLASHIWSSTGTYSVSVQGRCPGDTSLWTVSEVLPVKVDIWTGGTGRAGERALPIAFDLQHNYPNPFNAGTTLNYQLPHAAQVRIAVYDLRGRTVKILVDEEQPAGYHRILWDAAEVASSGVFIAHLTAAGYSKSVKMLLIK